MILCTASLPCRTGSGAFFNARSFQRLREVGLFNSNSWTLTGSAGVTRFEHAIGTAYLAKLYCEATNLKPDSSETRAILTAALIHDIATGPFGHTVERVLSPIGFSHAHVLKVLRGDYRAIEEEPYFAGSPPRLPDVVPRDELRVALDAVLGLPPYGPLIANDLDLDNIDNVVRGAMYLGLGSSPDLAIQLAKGQLLSGGHAALSANAIHLVPHWQQLRSALYDLLFDSREQVSAEAMIFDAARRLVKQGELTLADWRLTDHELIRRFGDADDPLVQHVARGIRLGRTYPVVHEYIVDGVDRADLPSDYDFELSVATWAPSFYACDLVFLKHDQGQTRRAVHRLSADGHTALNFGLNSRRATVTILTRRTEFDAKQSDKQWAGVAEALQQTLHTEVRHKTDTQPRRPFAPAQLW